MLSNQVPSSTLTFVIATLPCRSEAPGPAAPQSPPSAASMARFPHASPRSPPSRIQTAPPLALTVPRSAPLQILRRDSRRGLAKSQSRRSEATLRLSTVLISDDAQPRKLPTVRNFGSSQGLHSVMCPRQSRQHVGKAKASVESVRR